ncbi:MAG: Maf family protein [Oscillospiraceae bacterium]|nr:Maf family protein [Oscillospiraceae bacterium]
MPNIVLASKSPRRRELFSYITVDFSCQEADIDESVYTHLATSQQVLRLAEAKCRHIALEMSDSVVIGCDTLVEHSGIVMGKPVDREDAIRMLRQLSDSKHYVYTGVAIEYMGHMHSFVERTEVSFISLSEAEINFYVNTDEPYDKAGGYAIQGIASRYISAIVGDYFNVMGLPISKIYRYLSQQGILGI